VIDALYVSTVTLAPGVRRHPPLMITGCGWPCRCRHSSVSRCSPPRVLGAVGVSRIDPPPAAGDPALPPVPQRHLPPGRTGGILVRGHGPGGPDHRGHPGEGGPGAVRRDVLPTSGTTTRRPPYRRRTSLPAMLGVAADLAATATRSPVPACGSPAGRSPMPSATSSVSSTSSSCAAASRWRGSCRPVPPNTATRSPAAGERQDQPVAPVSGPTMRTPPSVQRLLAGTRSPRVVAAPWLGWTVNEGPGGSRCRHCLGPRRTS
jgi:hypothetical protein